MSAKDDYALARGIIRDYLPDRVTDEVRERLTDKIRAEITGAHLYERARWSKFLKEWADDLEENDEGYVALFFRDVADRIKNDDYTFGEFGPLDEDGALIAEDEREL